MKRIFAMVTAFFATIFAFLNSAFAAWDLTAVTGEFTAAKTDLQSFVVIILGVLATLWVARKFIKTTNRS